MKEKIIMEKEIGEFVKKNDRSLEKNNHYTGISVLFLAPLRAFLLK